MKKITLLLILPLFVNANNNISHFETTKKMNILNFTNVTHLDYGNSPKTYKHSFPFLIEGCMDTNASNFNADATEAGFDQYGNSLCVYASCDDISTWGCIYADGFGTFNADFSAAQCSEYGGTPCEEPACAPLDFTTVNTGSNMTLFINLNTVSDDLSDGDMIGVFFTNEAGDLICAGSSTWTGFFLMQIAAFGNDATTDVLDGFSAGDSIVWKTQTSSGIYDIVPTYDNGEGTYETDGLLVINSLELVYSCSGTLEIGCTDETAINYDSNAIEDDGSCNATVVGCMDAYYLEFDPAANVLDQTLCLTWKIEGCMDALACNFDSTANFNNGTCDFPLEGFDCQGNCISGTEVIVDDFYFGLSWTITACDGTDLANGEAPYEGCVELGENYVINLQNTFGYGWGGTEMIIEDNAYTLSNGYEQLFVIGSCGIAGCMDALACNFDSTATYDNGTCELQLEGFDCQGNCISGTEVIVGDDIYFDISWTITACDGTDLANGEAPYQGCVELGENYLLNLQNSFGYGWGGTEIIIEDNAYTLTDGYEQSFVIGSCETEGCMDALACNFDSTATLDNGNCEYAEEYFDCDGVCLNDYDNDGECDEIDYDDGLGMDETKKLKYRIYPNPVKNLLNISHYYKKEVLDIQIYNTIGLLIYEDRIKTVENDVTIDVKNLSPGMYMIKISNGKHSSSTTWIKK